MRSGVLFCHAGKTLHTQQIKSLKKKRKAKSAGKMAQRTRALAAPPEDCDLNPRTQMVANSHLQLQF